MKKKSIRSVLIGDRAFYAAMLAIVLPMIVQNTFTQVVGLLDNVMVGRVGTLQMSAVAIANQLIFVFNLCIFGGLAGAGIFAAQYAGAHDDEGVRNCFRMKCWIAFAALACALLIFLAVPRQLIALYLAESTSPADYAATMEYAMTYLRVMLIGFLPFAVTQIYASTLREVGETRLPMIASVTAILVNLVFNYLLIFGKLGFPAMGVTGAAIATVLSRFVEAGIIVVYTHAQRWRFRFIFGAYRSMRIPRALFMDILRRGMPLLLNELFWSSGIAVLMQCYSVRGLEVVAATNIAQTVFNLFSVVFMSMGSAVSIMVGQLLGAQKNEEAMETVWKLIAVSVATSLVMSVLLILASPTIPKIYNTEDSVRLLATSMLNVQAVIMPFMSFCHCCYFTLRAGGKTMITFFFDSVYTWVVCVPVAFCLAHFTTMAIVPLYFCERFMEVVKCVLGFALVKKGVWIHNIVGDREEQQ